MTVTYRTMFAATCPVDGTTDIYDLTVEMSNGKWLPVETLREIINGVTVDPEYQEQLTLSIAAFVRRECPDARVQTRGVHSGVETVVDA